MDGPHQITLLHAESYQQLNTNYYNNSNNSNDDKCVKEEGEGEENREDKKHRQEDTAEGSCYNIESII